MYNARARARRPLSLPAAHCEFFLHLSVYLLYIDSWCIVSIAYTSRKTAIQVAHAATPDLSEDEWLSTPL